MNKVIAIIAVILIVIFGFVMFKEANKVDLYNDYPHINAQEIGNLPEEEYYVYFFSESCGHCVDLKAEMEDWLPTIGDTQLNLYLVDTGKVENQGVYYTGEEELPLAEEMEASKEYKIAGTPSLMHFKNNELQNYFIGGPEIMGFLQQQVGSN
jgi:thioredoxin-related protein